MTPRKDDRHLAAVLDFVDRRWRWLVLAAWLGFCTWFLIAKSTDIRLFNLGDTDDNLRMAQVRAWLGGQDWFDLRQYRLNAPDGANIHWSRLVDLPIAGLILLLQPFLGGAGAERWAVAIAPLLPYLVVLGALALTVRRLIGNSAYPLAFLALFFAGSANGMFMPTRIDHHGWQLALLAIAVAGIADPKKARGGLTLGLATAASLAIGLELLIYLAVAGVTVVLSWLIDRSERDRLRAYSVSLAGGTGLAFLVFASNDNRLAVCDALSPVWLSNAMLGGGLLFALAWLSPADWRKRLALAAGAALVIAGFHVFAWPHCLSRLEGVSPEVQRLWLSNVREARPIYRHGWRLAVMIAAIPVTGLIGWALLAWLRRADRELLRRIVFASLPGLIAALLLLWQTRTGPAAQMLGTVGAAALLWLLVPKAWASQRAVVRVLGTFLIVIAGAGALVPLGLKYVPEASANATGKAIRKANYLCNSAWAWRPIAAQPKGVVFSFVDAGPRLIVLTPHNGIIGPYHRNGEQIGDVMKAFRGTPEQARSIIAKYRSDYLLVCPNSSTTTIFMSEAPRGFYAQLSRNQVPAWLTPVDLGEGSPFRMWKVAK